MKLEGEVLEQVAAAYALGTLGTRARRRFETLLQQDRLARRAWQQWEQRLSVLAQELPPVRPPDGSWQNIEQRIQAPIRAPRPARWLLIAAMLVLALVAAMMWLRRS